MGDGAALPVGVPVPWPLATPPDGWLKYNGAVFDKSKFPKLAAVYQSGVLPDLRGEFIRGWDDGRGVDAGRALLAAQAETKISNFHGNGSSGDEVSNGVPGSPPKNFGYNVDSKEIISSGFTAYGSQEMTMTGITSRFGVRPRNISFNYIVKAA